MENLEPVPGWDTVETNAGHQSKNGFVSLPSYRVISCPGYVLGGMQKVKISGNDERKKEINVLIMAGGLQTAKLI